MSKRGMTVKYLREMVKKSFSNVDIDEKGKMCVLPFQSLVDTIQLYEDKLACQEAETERLKDENIEERDIHFKNLCGYKDEIARLQKQVEELKSENTELYKEHTTLIAGSILEKQETAKDTAKEILDDLRNIFIEQSSYGSDVNQHIGYYEYEVKLGLVIEQIEEYVKEKYGIEYGVEVE